MRIIINRIKSFFNIFTQINVCGVAVRTSLTRSGCIGVYADAFINVLYRFSDEVLREDASLDSSQTEAYMDTPTRYYTGG